LESSNVRLARKIAVFSLGATASAAVLLASSATDSSSSDASLTAALCPIVYRLDESPSARGYHYTFFGNAFFINDQGDLLTSAHVLETFRNGGQPSIIVSRPNSPPQLLPITVIAADSAHDVAILHVTPNPFPGHFRVSFLSLATDPAAPGQAVLAISLHPAGLQNAQSFQSPIEDRSLGEILSFESTKLDKSAPAADIFLLSHPVTLGQSGSPVLARDSNAVVGLVEGRWLRDNLVSLAHSNGKSAGTPGAAVPIRYAISLLDEKHIPWHPCPRSSP
jgi:hypothetical protein